jgi:hypothetical protein
MANIDNDIKDFIEQSRREYRNAGTNNPPEPFERIMDRIYEKENNHFARRYSPWWIVAASLIGVLIGFCIPSVTNNDEKLLAVADTVYITKRDTVFVEKENDYSTSLTSISASEEGDNSSVSKSSNSGNKKETLPAPGKSLAQEEFKFGLLVSNVYL